MPAHITANVLVVSPQDRGLEQVLIECGARPSVIGAGELAALAHPAAHAPDVLLVDLRGGSAMPAALATVRRAHPNLGIAVVASTPDPQVLLEAMRAGATEFLTEPVSNEAVEQAIARLVASREPAASGDVFAFVGAKGGVGTTTTAVNVATVLAKAEPSRTLLIDLHLVHGDAALFLGAEPRFSINDALENTHRFDEAFFRGLVTSVKGGPDLLASSDHALAADTPHRHFRTVVEFAARLYRYVVLDVPRTDAASLDALDAATSIVVVANQELSTVRSASRMAAALRQRYGKDRVRVVVTRFDKQAEISPEDVEKVVGTKVRHLLPSDYRLALQALNRGRPLALENHNKLAASYRTLARDLAGLADESQSRPDPGSILGRLTGRG